MLWLLSCLISCFSYLERIRKIWSNFLQPANVPFFNPSQVLWNGWYRRVVVAGRCLRGGVAQAGVQQSKKYRLSRIFSAAFSRSRANRPAQRRGVLAVDTRVTTARSATTLQRIVTVHLASITLGILSISEITTGILRPHFQCASNV